MAVKLHSEAFGAMGNVVSEGIWNQLGRPELDRLALLLRESVQNSWDARASDSIDYALETFTLVGPQRDAYREFFRESPPPDAYRTVSAVAEDIINIDTWLESSQPRLLIVSDRGTRGLDGPTRADQPTIQGEERNFVDFLRNVGQPPTKDHGGGTFGYGKAAFYLASETRTIVVHTRCEHRGELEERLTAAALTHHFEHDGVRFTGRHWWGHVHDSLAEPLVGTAARDWAERLGLPPFLDDSRGTSVAVVAPVFNDEALSGLPWLCLRNLWPKLKAARGGRPPISVRLRVAGHELSVPDPSQTPPYDGFWRALTDIRQGNGEAITYRRESTGTLAIQHAVVRHSTEESHKQEHEIRPQHVALLRAPELVVKYLDGGRSLAIENVGFTGVFKAHADADHAFALSEPPTHDDWQPVSVRDKRCRGIVTQTLKKVRQQVREFAAPHSASTSAAEGGSLASLSNDFAELLPGLIGSTETSSASTGGKDDPKRPRQRQAKPQAKLHPDQVVVEVGGKPCVVFRVELTHARGSDRTRLEADVYSVISGGGRETEAPSGGFRPQAGWWESPRGTKVEGQTAVVGPRQQGTWSLFVPVPEPTAVAVEVTAVNEEAE